MQNCAEEDGVIVSDHQGLISSLHSERQSEDFSIGEKDFITTINFAKLWFEIYSFLVNVSVILIPSSFPDSVKVVSFTVMVAVSSPVSSPRVS